MVLKWTDGFMKKKIIEDTGIQTFAQIHSEKRYWQRILTTTIVWKKEEERPSKDEDNDAFAFSYCTIVSRYRYR